MSAKRYRWTCEGGHPGVLAPSRLRKVDVRRYCWPCSQKAGVLVERTCKALEARRGAKAERRAARTRVKADKVKAAKAVYPGNLAALFRTWQRLEAWDRPDIVRRAFLGSLRSRAGKWSTGHCSRSYDPRITLTVGAHVADGYTTLLHELAHAATPADEGHGCAWRTTFLEAAQEVTGEDLTGGYVSSQEVHDAVQGAFERMVERGDLPGKEEGG